MSDMPGIIYAYPTGHGTGTWIDFDDSSPGDPATVYIRQDLVEKVSPTLYQDLLKDTV